MTQAISTQRPRSAGGAAASVFVIVTSCGGPNGPSASVSPSSAPPALSSTASAPERARVDPRKQVEIESPARVSCALAGGSPLVPRTVRLRVAPTALPFAEVRDPRIVHLDVADGERAARIEVEVGRVHLVGWSTAADLEVYPVAALVMGDVFIPKPGAPLAWRGAADGLEVSLRDPVGGNALSTRARCADVALEPGEFGAPDDAAAVELRSFTPGVRVGVAPTSIAEPVLTLDEADLGAAHVLETLNGRARIVARVRQGWISGWVPSSVLRVDPLPFLEPTPMGCMACAPKGPDPTSDCEAPMRGATVVCDHPVSLILREPKHLTDAGVARRVGWIDGGAAFDIGREQPAFPEYADHWELGLPGVTTACLWTYRGERSPSGATGARTYFSELVVEKGAVVGCAATP